MFIWIEHEFCLTSGSGEDQHKTVTYTWAWPLFHGSLHFEKKKTSPTVLMSVSLQELQGVES